MEIFNDPIIPVIHSKRAAKFIADNNIDSAEWVGLIDFAHLPPEVGVEGAKKYRRHIYQLRCFKVAVLEALEMGVNEPCLKQGAIRNYLKWNEADFCWQLQDNRFLPTGYSFVRDYRKTALNAVKDAIEYFKYHQEETRV